MYVTNTNLTNVASHKSYDIEVTRAYLRTLPDFCYVWVYDTPTPTRERPEPEGEQIAHGSPPQVLAQFDIPAPDDGPDDPQSAQSTSVGGEGGLPRSGALLARQAGEVRHPRGGRGRGPRTRKVRRPTARATAHRSARRDAPALSSSRHD